LWAIDKIWPTLDRFYYSYFHKWTNRYSRNLYKIWNKIISFDMKKRGNLRHVIGKVKKKLNLRILRVNPYVSKRVLQSCLDPFVPFQMISSFWGFYLVPLLHLYFFGCFSWWCVPYRSTFEVNGHLGGFLDPFVMFCWKAILFSSFFSPFKNYQPKSTFLNLTFIQIFHRFLGLSFVECPKAPLVC